MRGHTRAALVREIKSRCGWPKVRCALVCYLSAGGAAALTAFRTGKNCATLSEPMKKRVWCFWTHWTHPALILPSASQMTSSHTTHEISTMRLGTAHTHARGSRQTGARDTRCTYSRVPQARESETQMGKSVWMGYSGGGRKGTHSRRASGRSSRGGWARSSGGRRPRAPIRG